MNNFKKIGEINSAKAANLLTCLPALWSYDTFRQEHPLSPHKCTQSIYLRWPKAMTAYAALYAQDFEDKPALKHKGFSDLLKEIELVLMKPATRAVFVKLNPYSGVSAHIDQGPFAESTSRYHLGITCPDSTFFYCGDEVLHIKNNELYWFDKHKLHKAINNSNEPRVHLIIDTVK